MAEKTRADLVAEVARRFGYYQRGTVDVGTTTTIQDTAGLLAPDDYWIGHYATIVTDAGGEGAAPEGEERPVTDYVQSTATLVVDPPFSAQVGSDDVYELLPIPRSEIEAALAAGVRAAGETWLRVVQDTTTVEIADGDYDYDLPTDLARLLAVWVMSGTSAVWSPVAGRLWRVSGTPGAQELLFDSLQDLADGSTVMLEYLARPSELSADSSTLGLGEPAETELVEFVVDWALFWLHDQAAAVAQAGAEFRPHLTQAQYYREAADAVRARAARFHGRGTVRGARWARVRSR